MPDGLISSRLLAEHGFLGAFSERFAPASDGSRLELDFRPGRADASLRWLCAALDLCAPPHQAHQVHGARHLLCHGPGGLHQASADILIAREGACAVRTADCLPILLAAPDSGWIAAVHAGWRGTVQGVARKAVAVLARMGADPGRMLASLGPCIGPCCFETGADVADRLAGASSLGEAAILRRDGRIHANLPAINRAQLLDAGLKPGNIELGALCTCCRPDRFHSHRRDGERAGRMLAVVAARSSP